MSETDRRVLNDRAPLNIERRPGRDLSVQVGAPTDERTDGNNGPSGIGLVNGGRDESNWFGCDQVQKTVSLLSRLGFRPGLNRDHYR